MALEFRQQLKLTQQLIMTPQLQMAIKLLQLSRLELIDAIRQEMEENPTLEETIDDTSATALPEQTEVEPPVSEAPQEVTIDERIPDSTDWSNYLDEYNTPGKVAYESERRDTPSFEAFVATKESLNDHMLWQFMMTQPDDTDQTIGSLIIGNLNTDGYLDCDIDDLMRLSGFEAERVEGVLHLLQTFDPPGVCARDLSECLLLQLDRLGIDDKIVTGIIRHHLKFLENRNLKAIAKALKIRLPDVVAAVKVIQELEPRPGRPFSDDQPQYITPDIYVHKYDDEFVIMLNDDGMPRLRVNTFYKSSFNKDGSKMPSHAKDYIQDKLRSAAWLIKSIHQRQKTIYKVMESILRFQREFFELGIAHLKPMVLRDVAQDIGMHESTISRVTTNKYTYTPQGIFELKYFFNSSIKRVHGGSIASASVQEKIRAIITEEDPRKPYSDDKIATILAGANVNIARRTVAKYRELMRILPSSKRKQL